jgi:23S rRNA (adenine2503-C2)-methyltransferase
MRSFYELSFDDLTRICQEHRLAPATPRLLFNWYYKKNRQEEFQHQDLSNPARQYVQQNFSFARPRISQITESEDRTVKFLMQFADGQSAESVLIPFQQKYTLCLSSQVGCAMNCAFCYTGRQGFTRHLSAAEIVGQLLQAKSWLAQHRPGDERVLNIVFMGQGEPLHNFDAVKKACEIFISQYGLSFAVHKITISTSGYLPGLQRWKGEMPNVNLALSLHAAENEKRRKLIPINHRYPLEQILPLIREIPQGEKRFVTFEYLLIKNFNDTESDARAVGELLSDQKAFVNLIPFNPFPGAEFERPESEQIESFKAVLDTFKIPTTIRTTKGDEILAACGQLHIRDQSKRLQI